MNRARLMAALRRDEGVQDRMYIDTVGVATLGVGHRLDRPIPPAAIDAILEADLLEVEADCARLPVWVGLSDARQEVLANMRFNLGQAGLLAFRQMWAALDRGDFAAAADAMLDSRWARQVGSRATRLARQMREDVPQ